MTPSDPAGTRRAPKRGPGRPRAMPVEQERTALVGAAITVFARRGRRGATLDEIAEVGGVNKTSIYSHFSGKDELLAAAGDAAVKRLGTAVADAYDPARPRPRPSTERLSARIGALLDFAASDADSFKLIMSTEREADADAGTGAKHLRDIVLCEATSMIAEELVDLGVEATTVDELAGLVATMVLGMVELTARRMVADPGWDREAVVAVLTRFAFGGVAAMDLSSGSTIRSDMPTGPEPVEGAS